MREEFFGNKLFEGVPEEKLRDLEVVIERRVCRAGEVLFDEGAAGDRLFLVVTGAVRISKSGRGGDQETLVVVGGNGYFGEMAMMDGRRRSARATAIEESVVGGLDRDGFERLLAAAAEITANFSRITIERLRQTSRHLIEQLLEAERLSLLGRMVGSIVHDFKNPMAVILQGTHYLKRQKDDPVSAPLGVSIENSVDRMLRMTQELLDFSRGVSKVRLERVSMERLLEPVEEEVFAGLADGPIDVVREIGYEGELVVDEHRVARLLGNVIRNAIEAMSEGGELRVSVSRIGGEVHFDIGDTGCGIPNDVARRIFEPFVTHGKSEGTGLGMAIAKSVVDAHGGRIRIESEVGRGTNVHIVLPVEPSGTTRE